MIEVQDHLEERSAVPLGSRAAPVLTQGYGKLSCHQEDLELGTHNAFVITLPNLYSFKQPDVCIHTSRCQQAHHMSNLGLNLPRNDSQKY